MATLVLPPHVIAIHASNIPHSASAECILRAFSRWGPVSGLRILPEPGQVLIEFSSYELARQLVQAGTIPILGQAVILQFVGNGVVPPARQPTSAWGGKESPLQQQQPQARPPIFQTPSPEEMPLLQLLVRDLEYPITDDVLRHLCELAGPVRRSAMDMIPDGTMAVALVEFERPQDAYTARRLLDGRDIYEKCCRIGASVTTKLSAQSFAGTSGVLPSPAHAPVSYETTQTTTVPGRGGVGLDVPMGSPVVTPSDADRVPTPRVVRADYRVRRNRSRSPSRGKSPDRLRHRTIERNRSVSRGRSPSCRRTGASPTTEAMPSPLSAKHLRGGSSIGSVGSHDADGAESSILMVRGLGTENACVSGVFNLFSVFGNVSAIKLFKSGYELFVDMTEPRFAEAALRFLDQQPISARNAVPSRHIRAYRGRMGKLVIHEGDPCGRTFSSVDTRRFRAGSPSVMDPPLNTVTRILSFRTTAAKELVTPKVLQFIRRVLDVAGVDGALKVCVNDCAPKSLTTSGLIEFDDISAAVWAVIKANNAPIGDGPLSLFFSGLKFI